MTELNTRRNLGTVCSEVLALVVSAFVLSLAFPGMLTSDGIGFFAFFALIPLFAVIHTTSWRLVPFYGFLFGFVFYLIFNYWLKTFHPLAILIVPIIKGGEMLLLFPVLKAADRLFRKHGYLVQAVVWVAYTYLSQDWFAGYPYGTIGYAIYRYLPLVQLASVTGIWGINFLMILPQAFLGGWLGEYLHDHGVPFLAFLGQRKIAVSVYGILVAAWVVFGLFAMRYWNAQAPDRHWRVATIQHSADTWKGGYTTYKRNFNTLRKLSLEALLEDPDMVIWSETAFVPSVAWHEKYPSDPRTADLVDEFVTFGKELSVPLLTGNPEGVIDDPSKPAVSEDGAWNRKDYNTVIFFENGKIKNTYRKQHLVPFTEHFPYRKQMPWLYNLLLANDYNWWETGTESVVFSTDEGVRFSTPICFEDIFGALNADFVRHGADVIVNMTNDGWSRAVSAEMQHLAMAVFRSVENRKTTVRGTNSGMTCVIDPVGRIVDPMQPFTVGYHIYDVPVYSSETHAPTLYTEKDDWFAFLSILLSIVLVAGGILYRIFLLIRKRQRS